MVAASLSRSVRDDRDQSPEGELVFERGHRGGHAVRVVRGVEQDRRRGAYPLQPPRRGGRREPRPYRLEVERPVRRPHRETPPRRPVRSRRSAPGARRAAAGTPRRTRRKAPGGPPPDRPPRPSRSITPNSLPSRAMVASTSARAPGWAASPRPAAARRPAWIALWTMPTFSTAISSIVSPSHSGVVQPDRGDHASWRVGDVGGVLDPADADLDHRDVDRRVGERRERHRRGHVEEGQGLAGPVVDQVGHGRPRRRRRRTSPARSARLDRDPLAHGLQVRAGVAPGP